mmetsp:Transcript_95697/g.270821  ORF Transcript_95697/g.270821 Transcript_95697/m.270821 type:complete len:206 (+) Transcript_95697:759-1376(+)
MFMGIEAHASKKCLSETLDGHLIEHVLGGLWRITITGPLRTLAHENRGRVDPHPFAIFIPRSILEQLPHGLGIFVRELREVSLHDPCRQVVRASHRFRDIRRRRYRDLGPSRSGIRSFHLGEGVFARNRQFGRFLGWTINGDMATLHARNGNALVLHLSFLHQSLNHTLRLRLLGEAEGKCRLRGCHSASRAREGKGDRRHEASY